MGGFFLSRNAACSHPPTVKIPGANIWLNDACPDGQMMFLPIVKNDAASCGRNDAMCSAHARSAHHEAKPRIMPAGRIMFRGGGTHHSPSVLTNTRRMGGFFLSLGGARSYPPPGQKTLDKDRAFFGLLAFCGGNKKRCRASSPRGGI